MDGSLLKILFIYFLEQLSLYTMVIKFENICKSFVLLWNIIPYITYYILISFRTNCIL